MIPAFLRRFLNRFLRISSSQRGSSRPRLGKTRRFALESLEERLNPAPVFSLRELVDSPTSLVIISPDVLGQVPERELEGSRVVVLNPGADAIGQITGSLAGLGRVDTLRLISHGSR